MWNQFLGEVWVVADRQDHGAIRRTALRTTPSALAMLRFECISQQVSERRLHEALGLLPRDLTLK